MAKLQADITYKWHKHDIELEQHNNLDERNEETDSNNNNEN